jgi:hypothetical protein
MIYVAQGYPEVEPHYQIKQRYEKFYRNLAEVLPCEKCKLNFTNHLSQFPPDMTNQSTLLEWLHTIHNQTLLDQNRKLIPTTKAFVQKYTKSASLIPNPLRSQNPILLIIALIALATTAYFLYGGQVR